MIYILCYTCMCIAFLLEAVLVFLRTCDQYPWAGMSIFNSSYDPLVQRTKFITPIDYYQIIKITVISNPIEENLLKKTFGRHECHTGAIHDHTL